VRFAVAILLRSESDQRTGTPWQFIVLCIEADDEAAAREKALEIARRYETEYKTASGARLRWRVDDIESLHPLDEFPPSNASELFSMFVKDSVVRGLREPIDE
jgi:hypothetical protein